jgi:hypothetical protein
LKAVANRATSSSPDSLDRGGQVSHRPEAVARDGPARNAGTQHPEPTEDQTHETQPRQQPVTLVE